MPKTPPFGWRNAGARRYHPNGAPPTRDLLALASAPGQLALISPALASRATRARREALSI